MVYRGILSFHGRCHGSATVRTLSLHADPGSGLSNSVIGQPDIGIFSLRENVDACRHIARSVAIPVMADADTGYGNVVTVFHAVEYFEEAGVVGINMEDQLMPKRCGHMRGKELVDTREMTMKIQAALKARKDPDFIINARTDAIAVEGIEGTQARVREYAAAGADMIYVDAIRSEDDIARVVEAADRPALLVGIETITGLMGYERITALENELLSRDVLERKYRDGDRSYVVPEKKPSK